MKNAVFWDVTPCGSCKNRRLDERSACIIRVTRIGELGRLAVTSNQITLRILPLYDSVYEFRWFHSVVIM
jgi:hypothetical protein